MDGTHVDTVSTKIIATEVNVEDVRGYNSTQGALIQRLITQKCGRPKRVGAQASSVLPE